jgi:hypothetical protein
MAEDRIDPSEQAPDADLLDQEAPLDPQSLTDAETVSAALEKSDDADDADRLEQHTSLLGDDEDDYPREPSGTGWS